MAKVNWEGKEYEFDYSDIDSERAMEIESKLDLGIIDLFIGLERGSTRALTAMFWYMKVSNGEKVEIEECKFKPVEFLAALNEAGNRETAEAEAAEAQRQAELVAQAKKGKRKTETLKPVLSLDDDD